MQLTNLFCFDGVGVLPTKGKIGDGNVIQNKIEILASLSELLFDEERDLRRKQLIVEVIMEELHKVSILG